MVVRDGVGDALQQEGLTGLGRGDDQHALALADGREHIHDAAADVPVGGAAGQVEFLVREEGSEEVERHPVADEFDAASVDGADPHQREIFVALARRTDLAGNGIAALEGVVLDLLLGDVDVVRGVEIVVVGGAEETVAVRHDFQDAGRFDRALELRNAWTEILLGILETLALVFALLLGILAILAVLLALLLGLAALLLFGRLLGLRSLRGLGGLLRGFRSLGSGCRGFCCCRLRGGC